MQICANIPKGKSSGANRNIDLTYYTTAVKYDRLEEILRASGLRPIKFATLFLPDIIAGTQYL